MSDTALIAALGVDFTHLGVAQLTSSRLRLYTDPSQVSKGGSIYRVVLQHPTRRGEQVRYLPADNATAAFQACEHHLHQLWGKSGCVTSVSQYLPPVHTGKTVWVPAIPEKRMGF